MNVSHGAKPNFRNGRDLAIAKYSRLSSFFQFCKTYHYSSHSRNSIARSASSKRTMGTLITGPPLGAPASSESQMAWHLAALLLSLGHPARPADLASRCTLFSASPELVEFLCSIPKSPIFLTTDLYVTLSAVTLVAVGRFISVNDFIASSVMPRVGIGASSTANWWNDFSISRICFRKRNRVFLDCDFLPVAKRAANIYSVNGNEFFPFRFHLILPALMYVLA